MRLFLLAVLLVSAPLSSYAANGAEGDLDGEPEARVEELPSDVARRAAPPTDSTTCVDKDGVPCKAEPAPVRASEDPTFAAGESNLPGGGTAGAATYVGAMTRGLQAGNLAFRRLPQTAAPEPVTPNVTLGKTFEFPPAANPEVQKAREDVVRLADGGDKAAAQEAAKKALESAPDDPALKAYAALTEPRKGVDSKTVNERAKQLLEGLRKEEEVPQEALLASPISFGAAGAAAGARIGHQPAAILTPVPDARALAVQREAARKIGMKDFVGAEAVLTRRIEEAPNDGSAFRLRALARRLTGRFADSAQDARKAVELDPKDSRSLHLLSRDLTDLGKPKEGVAEADRALAINEKDADAYVARSFAYAALNRPDEQLADLERAATLDAQFDSLYRNALAVRGLAAPSKRSWPVWFGAIGTALLFFSFALFRKRGDSSLRVALRRDDHQAAMAAAPVVQSVPKGFKVVKTLGQGGMGVVYEAVDLGLQRTVALKKLRAEIADNARERGRFLKEARTVAALKHPNIVEIHSIHEDAEGLFLVFERVPGESLHERLGKGPIAPAEAASFLRQIASALDYAHAQGVVHQDLKPGNVMIHAGLAKVMDFGIARRVQETLSTMSKVEVAGTPAYMAPEQEQGVVGPSADVFALGACAYETLTGVLPYPTGGLMLKAQKMYRKPSEATPRLTPAVDAAIARALEPKPEDRWPTATSFVDALSRALS